MTALPGELHGPGAVHTRRVQAGGAAADVVTALVAGLSPLPLPGVTRDARLGDAFPRAVGGTPAAQLLPRFILVNGHQALLLRRPLGPAAGALVPASGRVTGARPVPWTVLPFLTLAEDTVDIQGLSHGLPASAPAPAVAAAAFTPRVQAAVCLVPGAAVALHPQTRSLGPPRTRDLRRRPALGGWVLVTRPPPLTGRRGATAVLSEAVWGRR